MSSKIQNDGLFNVLTEKHVTRDSMEDAFKLCRVRGCISLETGLRPIFHSLSLRCDHMIMMR